MEKGKERVNQTYKKFYLNSSSSSVFWFSYSSQNDASSNIFQLVLLFMCLLVTRKPKRRKLEIPEISGDKYNLTTPVVTMESLEANSEQEKQQVLENKVSIIVHLLIIAFMALLPLQKICSTLQHLSR